MALTKNTDFGPQKEVSEAALLLEELTGKEMVIPETYCSRFSGATTFFRESRRMLQRSPRFGPKDSMIASSCMSYSIVYPVR
jgi:hypothetical protein